jgi:hypothetical protein
VIAMNDITEDLANEQAHAELLANEISDDVLELAAGTPLAGGRTWDMTSCSYCSISVC